MKRVLVALAIAAVVIATPSIARADTVWGQRFQDQPSDWLLSNSGYTLTQMELRWATGNQFSGVNPFNFSAAGWSSTGGATWGSASGPGVNLIQFNINFLTPTGGTQETSFDYYVYLMDNSSGEGFWMTTSVSRINGSWVIDPAAGRRVTPPPYSVPEPSSMLLFGAGLFGLAFAVRRRSPQ